MKKNYLEVGRIVGTRGLNGEIKVESWCDTPEVICKIERLYLGCGDEEIGVKSARVHKGMVLLSLDGVSDIGDADKLKGKVIYAFRADIPKENDSYFIQDLLNMKVIDIDNGVEYGKIRDVFATGANDVYTIETGSGRVCYLPAIPDIVIEINMEEEKILIRPIEGIFEDDN